MRTGFAISKCLMVSALALASCTVDRPDVAENAIVSTSLCVDGYLHAMPELEPRLAALSWQSRSALSQTPERLRDLPQTSDDLERALKWGDAMQVSNAGGRGDIDLSWGEDFETVWSNLAVLAKAFGARDPSFDLKARLEAVQKIETAPRILYLDRSGATAGPGTFVDAVIRAAGGRNIIDNPGWQSPDTERLIRLQPDIILTSFMGSDYAGVTDRTSRHQALASKISNTPRINIPGKFWPCAGPGLVAATEMLSAELAKR